MSREAKKSVDWHCVWQNDNGVFMQLRIAFTMRAVINDAVTKLTCYIEPPTGESNVVVQASWGNGLGYGFINVGGFAWAGTPFYDRVPDDQRTTYPYWEWWTGQNWASDPEAINKWNTEYRYANDVWSKLNAVFPTVGQDTIVAVYAADDTTNRPCGTFGYNYTREFDISETGNNLDINLIRYYTRWRDNTPSNGHEAYAVIESFTDSDLTMSFYDLFPNYFPCSRRIGGEFKSCNRGGGQTRKEGGGRVPPLKRLLGHGRERHRHGGFELQRRVPVRRGKVG